MTLERGLPGGRLSERGTSAGKHTIKALCLLLVLAVCLYLFVYSRSTVRLRSAVPGAGLSGPAEDLAAQAAWHDNYQQTLDCWASKGRWVYDRDTFMASPRGYAFAGRCQNGLVGRERDQELAHFWVPPAEACGAPYHVREHLVLELDAAARRAGVERLLVLYVGDSMQLSFCTSATRYVADFVTQIASAPNTTLPSGTRVGHAALRTFRWLAQRCDRNDFLSLTTERLVDQMQSINIQEPWVEHLAAFRSNATAATRRAGVIVLNRGAHYRPLAEVLAGYRETLAYIRQHAPEALIFIRTTPAGHPNCGAYVNKPPLTEPLDVSTWRGPWHWGDFEEQNRAVRAMVHGMHRVFVLDVVPATSLRADSHLSNTNDCLHYCAPGPIDMWVELLYNAILRALELHLL